MSMTYMLDTDTCAFILRKSSQALLQRIAQVPLSQQVISNDEDWRRAYEQR